MTIGEYIVHKLASVTQVTGKVFPMIAPQGAAMPFVTYRRSSTSVEYSYDGAVEDTTSVTFMVVAASYKDAVDLATVIRGTFENRKESYTPTVITPPGATSVTTETIHVSDCNVIDVQDEYVVDQDCYVTTISLRFWSHVTTQTTGIR